MNSQKSAKYHFNPSTLSWEKVVTGRRELLQKITWPAIFGLVLGVGTFFLFAMFVPSPKEKQLQAKYDAAITEYMLLSKQMDGMQEVMNDLEQRDNNLYRALLQAEPIPTASRLRGSMDVNYYDSVAVQTGSQLIADIAGKADQLEKALYVQTKSYDEILALAKESEVKMQNLPAIQPVLNKDLTRIASGYGWRVDPVYNTRRFHEGMDFTAPTGTDVYATGNGTVTFSGWRQGFGNVVIIDHGFNYETYYAHLSKSLVREGQRVIRGDIIALVGNTGKSTGPHLHYEVHFKGAPVDPRNFYFMDLSPEDYDRMVQLANNAGNMLD
ncbi:MAG: M23 family metallopeptidase [Paludibacteraceae bacterium]|nr:M23 family metallopeptidase [Paludibacteraceae bacterium]